MFLLPFYGPLKSSGYFIDTIWICLQQFEAITKVQTKVGMSGNPRFSDVIPFSSSIRTESFLCFQFQPGRVHGLKLKMSHLCSSLNGSPITVRMEANVEKINK